MKLRECEQKLHSKINSLLSVLAEHHDCDSNIGLNAPNDAHIMHSNAIGADDLELILAAGTGDLHRVFALLYCDQVNPNISNVSGATPLLQTTLDTQENLSIVELLLDRGADVNATTPDGLTALIIASIKGYKNIVLRLLKAGADMRKKDMFGYTAEALAIRLGHNEISDILVDNSKQ
ncbi:MAG: ankyrin repeat domain-containing protein [Pseudomonadota bacterium]|jgi:ankyrin repeat protein|nr:ankyrin repeat domain-containing protein [Pseudomonadota bacterium]